MLAKGLRIGLALGIFFITGCAIKRGPVAPTAIPGHQLSIEEYAFKPQTIVVPMGITLTWVNRQFVPHTVTSGLKDKPDGVFDSGWLFRGWSFSYRFEKKGTYHYYCTIHPYMVGTVVVE